MLTAHARREREIQVRQLIEKGVAKSTIQLMTKANGSYIARIRRKIEKEILDNC
jgi:hypothetical protein